jgi:hypothetical protein
MPHIVIRRPLVEQMQGRTTSRGSRERRVAEPTELVPFRLWDMAVAYELYDNDDYDGFDELPA